MSTSVRVVFDRRAWFRALPLPMRGRGTDSNPANRFEATELTYDPDAERVSPRTQIIRDASKTIISYNDSPDVGFAAGINPYRGCEHGCVYCYARPFHEYLSFSAGLDFETKIIAKYDAAKLLRHELASPKWRPQVLAMSGVTDCYQPIERDLKITRACLDVLNECKNPVGIITKNRLILRDLDILSELAAAKAACVYVSVTTCDKELARLMEPRASQPLARLETIRGLSEAGIPVGVLIGPVIPGLTDHEIPQILGAAAQSGATLAGYTMLRLPHGVEGLFTEWLHANFPDRADKVMNQLREIKNGNVQDNAFSRRMRGQGIRADHIAQLFDLTCRKLGLNVQDVGLSTVGFKRPALNGQMELF